MPNRTIFYFDGFNFYYGLKKSREQDPVWQKYYWLDFKKFCEQFLGPDHKLEKIKYFTAQPLALGKKQRQARLFRANRLLSPDLFSVIKGKYILKNMWCPNCRKYFEKPEEKRTDVNISVHMLQDCYLDRADTLILISADSDLVTPVRSIKTIFTDKKIKVYFPPSHNSKDLRHTVGGAISLSKNIYKFDNAVLPDTVSVDGETVEIPPEWVYNPPII